MKQRLTALLAVVLLTVLGCDAQQINGISGLVQTPTGETAPAGAFSIGAHWRNRHDMPVNFFADDGLDAYDSWQFHAGVAAFDWMEISYSILLFKMPRYATDESDIGYYAKDQQFCIKFRLLREGRWWPSIAIGGTDVFTSAGPSNQYQASYYAAATKTVDLGCERLKASLAWRHWPDPGNKRWQGLCGGVEYTPSFAPMTSAMAEWTGCHVNLGLNALLFKHVRLQASLLNWRWPSAGVAFTGSLF